MSRVAVVGSTGLHGDALRQGLAVAPGIDEVGLVEHLDVLVEREASDGPVEAWDAAVFRLPRDGGLAVVGQPALAAMARGHSASVTGVALGWEAALNDLRLLVALTVTGCLPAAEGRPEPGPLDRLTSRETEILGLLCVHGSARAVADALGISAHTARTHVGRILTKLGLHSQLEAVAFARRSGLSSLGDRDGTHPDGRPLAEPAGTAGGPVAMPDHRLAPASCRGVVVAEPRRLRAESLAAALVASTPAGRVAAVTDGRQLVDRAAAMPGAVVLLALDLEADLPGTVLLVATLRSLEPSIRVLALGDHLTGGELRRVREAGASGVFDVTHGLDELVEAVQTVGEGPGQYPQVPDGVATGPPGSLDRPKASRGASLTAREREVLQFLADGLSHREIAERLFLSPHTARTHIRNVLGKLGAHRQVDAVLVAIDRGLVDRDGTTPARRAPASR